MDFDTKSEIREVQSRLREIVDSRDLSDEEIVCIEQAITSLDSACRWTT